MMKTTMQFYSTDIPSLEVAFAFGYFSIAFMLYFFSLHSRLLEDRIRKLPVVQKKNIPFIYFIRVLGFLLLGLIPSLIFIFILKIPLYEFGLRLPVGNNLWLWWMIPIGALLLGITLRSGKYINIDFYPQVHIKTWSLQTVIINGLTWSLFLIGYEIAFRGYLFLPVVQTLGLMPAMMINCSLYSISHIPKGVGEAFGAFFLGMLFCAITYQTDSILIPLVLHILLAISNDWIAVKVNPDIAINMK